MSKQVNAGSALQVIVATKPTTTARQQQGRRLDEEVKSASNYLKEWRVMNSATLDVFKAEMLEGATIDPESDKAKAAKATELFGQMQDAGAKGYIPNIALVYALSVTPKPFALIPFFQTDKEIEKVDEAKDAGRKATTTGTQFAGIVERMLRTPAEFNARIIALSLMDNPDRLNFSKVVTDKNRQEVVNALNAATEGHALRFATTKDAIKALAPPKVAAPKATK